MHSSLLSVTNVMIVVIVLLLLYQYWMPFIRGKKITAVVDGYCHPEEGKNKDIEWVCRFMYREQKAGKRLYCYSRKKYDTREQVRQKFPKGSEVEIRYYKDGTTQMKAVVTSQPDEKKQMTIYSVLTVIGAVVIVIAYQLLLIYTGSQR